MKKLLTSIVLAGALAFGVGGCKEKRKLYTTNISHNGKDYACQKIDHGQGKGPVYLFEGKRPEGYVIRDYSTEPAAIMNLTQQKNFHYIFFERESDCDYWAMELGGNKWEITKWGPGGKEMHDFNASEKLREFKEKYYVPLNKCWSETKIQ